VIDSVVASFTTAGNAHWYYRQLVTHAARTGSSTAPLQAHIGNEHAAATVGTLAYTVLFRRGRYVATVTEATTSTSLKVSASTVNHYAAVVDRRIQQRG
jgi:hypothetical protein